MRIDFLSPVRRSLMDIPMDFYDRSSKKESKTPKTTGNRKKSAREILQGDKHYWYFRKSAVTLAQIRKVFVDLSELSIVYLSIRSIDVNLFYPDLFFFKMSNRTIVSLHYEKRSFLSHFLFTVKCTHTRKHTHNTFVEWTWSL